MDGLFHTGADSAPRVCLDFGTSFSKASVYLGAHAIGEACLAPLRLGDVSGAEHAYFTPTAIYLDEDRLHFGPKALMRAQAGVRSKRDPILSFKMVLSARDIEGTLALKLGPSVDPSRTLSHRQALTLYFAYLDQLIRAAILTDKHLPNTLTEAPIRLTSPFWQHEHAAEQTLRRLFLEAEVVSARLGPALISPEGACLEQARRALDEAAHSAGNSRFAGVVMEVQSVAAAYANFAKSKTDHLLVMDIGAGTTDIAGFRLHRAGAANALEEIKAARTCCSFAGDEVDTVLVDLMLRKSGVSSVEGKARVWRALRLSARELKRDLVETGKCSLTLDGRKITLRRKALLEDPGFKDFCGALSKVLAKSMDLVLADAGGKSDSLTVCLAGGGAHLPVADAIVAQAAKRRRGNIKILVERFDYGFARHRIALWHERFDKTFSQIVIAMGGALAEAPQEAAGAERAA